MNPEAESANNEGAMLQNRQKPPLKTNNEPRAESANNEGTMLHKTGRNRHLKLTMNPEAESANNEGDNATNRQKPPLKLTMNPEAESANNEEGSNAIIQAETAKNN
jgi:hypothetical protein